MAQPKKHQNIVLPYPAIRPAVRGAQCRKDYNTWYGSDDGYPPGAVGQPFHPCGGDAAGILLPDHADLRQEKFWFKGQHHVGLQGVGEPGGDEGVSVSYTHLT